MADTPHLMPFRPDDRFLRRIGLPGQIKRGLVHWRAFKEKDATLSLTLQDESLQDETAIEAYREYFSKFIRGDLPGIVWLSFCGLTQKISPPMVPRHSPDDNDSEYGHLHCVIDSPTEKDQMELLAKLVNDGIHGGLLREFVRKDAA